MKSDRSEESEITVAKFRSRECLEQFAERLPMRFRSLRVRFCTKVFGDARTNVGTLRRIGFRSSVVTRSFIRSFSTIGRG
jgi:hypothetical protein